jgi:hypothetical protein
MGRWSKPVNAVAITWVIFISVVLFFPPSKPITATNMNYAICIAAFIMAVSMTWWFVSAKHKYTGPRTKEIIIEIPTDDPEFIDRVLSP